jgi:arginine exporter protein ArgO
MKARQFLAYFFIFSYGIAMALAGYLGRGAFVDDTSMISMTLIAAGIATVIFWAIWNLDIKRVRSEEETVEKRKRQDFDSTLRSMSDAELMSLKRRLAQADFGDEPMIDDEGELIYGDSRR